MSGIENLNYEAFHAAAKRLRSDGFTVFNPADNFGGDQTRPYNDYIRLDLRYITLSLAVALLPGWEDSKGRGHWRSRLRDGWTYPPCAPKRCCRCAEQNFGPTCRPCFSAKDKTLNTLCARCGGNLPAGKLKYCRPQCAAEAKQEQDTARQNTQYDGPPSEEDWEAAESAAARIRQPGDLRRPHGA